ncbi:FHA domain-containing protein [Haliangium sp.]|uniref:FHA domain-containing protein n=1 Tax=Haliangium sp. TaxID=2663208 RepID=UPI003D0F86AE
MACVLALLGTRPAAAEGPPWLRIDQVQAEPSVFEGLTRLQLFVTAVDLHGAFLGDITGDRAFTLEVNGRAQRVPYLVGTFRGVADVSQELIIAIVIETTAPFADVLGEIKAQTGAFLESLPKGTQVLIVGYDDEVSAGARPGNIARARRVLDDLDVDPTVTDPSQYQLVAAVEHARRALSRARPELAGAGQRRYIVVISDGHDADPTPQNYRAVAKRAGREGIRIHSIGYPPDRNRYPLLGLGEMSKRSEGTFRLVLTRTGFAAHFTQLQRETLDQYLLTYFLPSDQIANKRIELEAASMRSERVRVPRPRCGGESCEVGQCVALRCLTPPERGSAVLTWVLVLVGVIVGVLVTLFLIGVWMGRRQRRLATAAAMAQGQGQDGHQEESEQAPKVHQIVPQGPAGQPVPGQPVPGAAHGGSPQATAGYPGAGAPAPVQRVMPSGPSGAYPAAGSGAMPALAPPSLLMLSGPLQGRRIPLQHGFVIGTAPNCHLVLAGDTYASSHHAQILMDTAGGCTLVDRGSTNGTYVNGVRTTQKRLTHGMLIKIGATEARFLTQ